MLPSGGRCRCFDAGEWSCGPAPSAPIDGGFSIDSGSSIEDTTFAPPPVDTGARTYDYPLSEGGCADRSLACTDPTTIPNAQMLIASLMMKCGLQCTRLGMLVGPDGCPSRITTNNDWIEGAVLCTADAIAQYRWPCSPTFDVATFSCPK